MPVDEGVRDAYLTMLKDRLSQLQGERDRLRSRIDAVRLADQCFLALSSEQRDVLLGVVQREDLQALVAERQETVSRIQALQALCDLVRRAS